MRGRSQLLALLAYVAGGLLPLLALAAIYWDAGDLYVFLRLAFLVPLQYAHEEASMGSSALKHVTWWGKTIAAAPFLFGSFTLLLALGLVLFFRRALVGRRPNSGDDGPDQLAHSASAYRFGRPFDPKRGRPRALLDPAFSIRRHLHQLCGV